jgi:hypothetical protein
MAYFAFCAEALKPKDENTGTLRLIPKTEN